MVYYARPPADPETDRLPTYEAAVATVRDPVPLFGACIRREDVFSAALVCRAWSAALAPVLWDAPHRYWGMGERSELGGFLFACPESCMSVDA